MKEMGLKEQAAHTEGDRGGSQETRDVTEPLN